MGIAKLLALLLAICTAIAQSQDLVLLGDSLSDGGSSGNGYSTFVKLVLQTNDVSEARPEGTMSWKCTHRVENNQTDNEVKEH